MAKVKKQKIEVIGSEPYFLTEEQAYEFCQETNQLLRGVKIAYMLLAERLYRIQKQKLYKPVYEKFFMYLDEIDIHESTASRLISIYEKFVLEHQIEPEVIKDIEYTKLTEIRKVSPTRELAEHWIEEARVLPLRELKMRIKAMTAGVDEMKCEHGNTYLVRCCRTCGEKWEEFGDEAQKHDHEED